MDTRNFEGWRSFATKYLNRMEIWKMCPQNTVCEGPPVIFDQCAV